MADHVRESFVWCWRRASGPPHPLPEDFHALCPHFSLPEAEGAAADFELPEMVQATFYAMLLNEAVELGVVHSFMAEGLKSALVGLRWSSFEVWINCVDHEPREAQLRWQAVAVEVRGPLDVYKKADHPRTIHFLPNEAPDGVHQGDDVMSGVREFLQTVPGYDVN
ncbi:hypothetical protein Cgig2_033790 [Carnegiea gigantea]|uniref:Uncharacterized protein n=1 Tax=Carnegiea gigantea TaxID=171969 RepID=A0A9Q1GN97_9CARY|nr:hypothetical protein Cgig2_033790 [Carnegiea gigantea]